MYNNFTYNRQKYNDFTYNRQKNIVKTGKIIFKKMVKKKLRCLDFCYVFLKIKCKITFLSKNI